MKTSWEHYQDAGKAITAALTAIAQTRPHTPDVAEAIDNLIWAKRAVTKAMDALK